MQPTHPNYPYPSSPNVTSVMRANKRADTKPEVSIRSYLHRLGLRFRKDMPIKTEMRTCRPDIIFTKQKVVIFVDGCFWHSCPLHGHAPKANEFYWKKKLKRNVERDGLDTKSLTEEGWIVIRIWEHIGVDKAVKQIVAQLKKKQISGH
jgi:DNA mismatch endonuclease (patch repair protein)